MNRPCVYCTNQGADVCVREAKDADGTVRHVFAHRACAEKRGIRPLYAVLEPTERELTS